MYHIGVVLFMLFNSLSQSEHALYLSVVEISDMEEGMDITIKVFRDDMVDALRNHGDALQSTMDSLDDGEIRDYFSEYIKLYPIQDQSLEVRQITVEGDSFFISLFTDRAFNTVGELGISHFFELFSNQKNIIKISTRGHQYYYTYKSPSQLEDLSDLH